MGRLPMSAGDARGTGPASGPGSQNLAEGRVYYLDALRVAAIGAVVMIHVAAMAFADRPVGSLGWYVCNAFDSCVRWAVPVFVMISGVLFLNPAKQVTVASVWRKSIRRIAVLFAVWSVVYVLARGWGSGPKGMIDLFVGGYYHLWFLWMIAALYACTPLIRKMVEDGSLTRYFIVLGTAFMVVIPLAVRLWDGPSVSTAWNLAEHGFPVGFALYFVLGRYLATWDPTHRQRVAIYAAGFVGVVATFALTGFASVRQGALTDAWYSYFSPTVYAAAVAVFVWGRRHLMFDGAPVCAKKAVVALSRCSLGIYLVHVLVLELLDEVGFNGSMFTPLAAIPVVWVAVTAISLCCSALLARIPLVGRHIV